MNTLYKIQSVIFDKKKFSLHLSKEWLKKNGYKDKGLDDTDAFYRFRQFNPTTLKKQGFHVFRNKKLGKTGVELIIAYNQCKCGGKIENDDLHHFLYSSYYNGKDFKNWKLDHSLSDNLVQVYFNGKDAVVVHRGTYDLQDLKENALLALNVNSNLSRLEHSRDIQQKAEAKYGANNVITIGHSKGALYSEKVGQNSREIYTLNKPVLPQDIFKKIPDKQTDIRTTLDPFSILRPLQRGNKHEHILSRTLNPITEHFVPVLKRVSPSKWWGKGEKPYTGRCRKTELKNNHTWWGNGLNKKDVLKNYQSVLTHLTSHIGDPNEPIDPRDFQQSNKIINAIKKIKSGGIVEENETPEGRNYLLDKNDITMILNNLRHFATRDFYNQRMGKDIDKEDIIEDIRYVKEILQEYGWEFFTLALENKFKAVLKKVYKKKGLDNQIKEAVKELESDYIHNLPIREKRREEKEREKMGEEGGKTGSGCGSVGINSEFEILFNHLQHLYRIYESINNNRERREQERAIIEWLREILLIRNLVPDEINRVIAFIDRIIQNPNISPTTTATLLNIRRELYPLPEGRARTGAGSGAITNKWNRTEQELRDILENHEGPFHPLVSDTYNRILVLFNELLELVNKMKDKYPTPLPTHALREIIPFNRIILHLYNDFVRDNPRFPPPEEEHQGFVGLRNTINRLDREDNRRLTPREDEEEGAGMTGGIFRSSNAEFNRIYDHLVELIEALNTHQFSNDENRVRIQLRITRHLIQLSEIRPLVKEEVELIIDLIDKMLRKPYLAYRFKQQLEAFKNRLANIIFGGSKLSGGIPCWGDKNQVVPYEGEIADFEDNPLADKEKKKVWSFKVWNDKFDDFKNYWKIIVNTKDDEKVDDMLKNFFHLAEDLRKNLDGDKTKKEFVSFLKKVAKYDFIKNSNHYNRGIQNIINKEGGILERNPKYRGDIVSIPRGEKFVSQRGEEFGVSCY